jgi:membrane carboxypeptidase/penicillin-binding protein
VLYSDGSLLAKLGEVTRYEVKYDEMNPAVTQAIVASEDKTFWTNAGVDFTGVMRAAWNNVTGGAQQGDSTITQQYHGGRGDGAGVDGEAAEPEPGRSQGSAGL